MKKIRISWQQYPEEFNHYKLWIESLGFEASTTEGDLLLVVGGKDIGVDLDRDEYENNLIEEFRKARKPIIGICRGMQLLGIKEGLALVEHLPDIDNVNEHLQIKTSHYVNFGNSTFKVNSLHHQGFLSNKSEWCYSDDGIVEALKTDWFSAVQWHPEKPEMAGEYGREFVENELKRLLNI